MTINECAIDTEARSDVDIRGKKLGPKGSGRYFRSPHFLPLIARWSINKGPMEEWRIGQPCPESIKRHVAEGGTFRGFNVSFERRFLRWLEENQGWPHIPIDRYRCTAAEAAAMALPRSLEAVATALNCDINKDKRGEAYIKQFSVPRKPRPGEDPNGVYFNEPWEFPEDFDGFSEYCAIDVLTEQAVAARTIPLSDYEQAVYVMDQVINDRGIRIDRRSAVAAVELARRAMEKLDREMRDVTDGYVPRCTNTNKLVEWVQANGVALNSAQKADLIELLECDDLPDHVRRAVELRQAGGKSSVSKFQAMLDYADPDDDRMRHLFVYHAASTGRWQSRGFNNYNLPRPRKVFDDAVTYVDEKGKEYKHAPNQEILFSAIRTGLPEMLDELYGHPLGEPMHLLSDAIRGFEWAAPGKTYIQADYSGIEGAVIAWSSGEDWKLKAMHEIIANPDLPDMYMRTAAGIVGVDVARVMKGGDLYHLRQALGKISELSLSYGGGVSAFVSMSKNYNVKLDSLYEPVWNLTDKETRERTLEKYANARKRGAYKADVLSREAWLACEITKTGWRAQNSAIAKGWKLREDAMREAIRNPGVVVPALKMKYVVKMGFLIVMLPSTRCLFYAAPKLRDQVKIDVLCDDGTWEGADPIDRELAEKLERQGKVKIRGASSPAITTLGVDKTGKKMQREFIYGGASAENDSQGIARDLLVNGMLKCEAAGLPIVGTTYDEILCEIDPWQAKLAEFERMICELPKWAAGMPLTAGGWTGKRYRKQ